ncbi:MAG: hypothetical protein ABI577_17020 [bacterium]
MAEPVTKDELHRLIDSLPEGATWDDIKYIVYVRAEIEDGRRSAREEPTFSTEEVLEEFGAGKGQ